MVGHGGSSAGSYLADPTSPIPSHCASIVVTSTLRVNWLTRSIALTIRKSIHINTTSCYISTDQKLHISSLKQENDHSYTLYYKNLTQIGTYHTHSKYASAT